MIKPTRKAISWCLKNDIKVIVKPQASTRKAEVLLEVHRQGKVQVGKEVYQQDKKLHKKIEELYIYLYKTLK